MTTTIDISTLQAVRDLLSLLETDTEVILTQANRPIAKITTLAHAHISKAGRVPDMQSEVWVSDDFDDPLPEKYWITRTL